MPCAPPSNEVAPLDSARRMPCGVSGLGILFIQYLLTCLSARGQRQWRSMDDDPGMRRAVTIALGVGLIGAVGAAVTGVTDWSETQGRARRTGLIHGLLNVAATSLIAMSFFRRMNDSHTNARGYAWSGYALALAAGYLGGDLVFAQGVGVMTDEASGRPDCDRGEQSIRREYGETSAAHG